MECDGVEDTHTAIPTAANRICASSNSYQTSKVDMG